MILSALYKRLKAIEARPTAQRPLQIVGGLPSGSAMLQALAAGARTVTGKRDRLFLCKGQGR
jgi:hypothetical protein